MTARESHQVELVSATGAPIGVTSVSAAHRFPGQLHRAFSVMLRDEDGRVLLQQRSAHKTRFAGRWANSCCGHPAPGVPVVAAATARMREELRLRQMALTQVGVFTYRAVDRASGRVEHEYDHVLVGELAATADVTPDPVEVAAVTWVSMVDLALRMADDPADYVPWLVGVLGVLAG